MELKQLEYFAACVGAVSFNKAAEKLYTTQSSVSRAIKALEDELGIVLFDRDIKGIRLTREGEKAYEYASQVLDAVKRMQVLERGSLHQLLRLSANSSSWLADRIVDYYQIHEDEDIHYQITFTTTREIVRRIQEREDDMGLVSIRKNQLASFHIFLAGHSLAFQEIVQTRVAVYLGKRNPGLTKPSSLRLVQRFSDEYDPGSFWNLEDAQAGLLQKAETVMETNSEELISRLLKKSSLAYIGPEELMPEEETKAVMPMKDEVIYGCIQRKGEELPEVSVRFLAFVRNCLNDGRNYSQQ